MSRLHALQTVEQIMRLAVCRCPAASRELRVIENNCVMRCLKIMGQWRCDGEAHPALDLKNNRFRGSSLKCTSRRFRNTCCVKTASWYICPDDDGSIFLPNVCKCLPDYTTSLRQNSYLHSPGLRKFPFTYHVLLHRSVSVSCKTFQELQLLPRRRILIARARVRSQTGSRGISGYQRDILTGYSPSTSIFLPVKYHSIYVRHSSILDATQRGSTHQISGLILLQQQLFIYFLISTNFMH